MSEKILKELDAEGLRNIFLKYTRKAFNSLPKIDNPRILDIGCGTGQPSLELLKLSDGEVYGIDIDQGALEKFKLKIKQNELSERLRIYNRSIYSTHFDDDMFDIIWEEGVLHLLNIDIALTECRRLLKLNGFMVSGETNSWAGRSLRKFPKFGFKLIKEINWERECWWTEYYAPLEEKIKILKNKYGNIENIEQIRRHLKEIEMVKKNPSKFDCTTYIMQKIK